MAKAIVWWFRDGRRGHERQAAGLLAALSELTPLDVHELVPLKAGAALAAWLRRRWPVGLPSPGLLIGAGHATHLSLLAAQRARGGRTIVLMQPSLPNRWFDLCLVPEHDRARPAANVIATRGPLNPMRPGDKDPHAGLILIGGPAGRGGWSDDVLVERIGQIVAPGDVAWGVTTSARTPSATVARLRSELSVDIVDGRSTGPDWLPRRLARASRVWVTEDSVSMLYEALSAGCAVGLLATGARQRRRLVRAVEKARRYGGVTTFDEWQAGGALTPPAEPLREAERCAHEICERWL